MSTSSWKIAPLLALLALGLFVLLPGGPSSAPSAEAAFNCDSTHRIDVEIVDGDTDARIVVTGARVRISPDPIDSGGTLTYTDGGTNDDTTTTGRIRENDACATTDASVYTISLISLPEAYDCATLPDDETTALTGNVVVTLTVDNCDVSTPTATVTATTTATVTPTVTTTPAGATAVTVSAAPITVNCSGSSFVTVVVKAGGVNIADGTTVSVTSTSGSLSPTSAPTSGGGILTIFTAGASSGTATITASAGGVSGTTTVTVNCGAPTAVPTSPPPPPVPTVAPSGGIRPPNTGDAGLASDGGFNWLATGAILLVAGSAVSGLVLARRRN